MIVLFFVDLRAAFDSVDRRKLLKAMEERGVRKGLIRRCKDVVGEIIFRVRVGKT